MEVNITGFGSNSDFEAQVDASHGALRASCRPIEHLYSNVNGGHYSIASQTGLIAAGIASAGQIFQVRWADSTKIFILKKFIVQASTCTGFAATALGAPLELIVGHGSTANGSGGTALAPTSISNKMRATMATTGFNTSGELRIATTAALTAATGQTAEAAPIASCAGADNRTLVSTPPMTLFDQTSNGSHPLILQTGDTLVLRTNSPAATGTWTAFVTMEWVEATNY